MVWQGPVRVWWEAWGVAGLGPLQGLEQVVGVLLVVGLPCLPRSGRRR